MPTSPRRPPSGAHRPQEAPSGAHKPQEAPSGVHKAPKDDHRDPKAQPTHTNQRRPTTMTSANQQEQKDQQDQESNPFHNTQQQDVNPFSEVQGQNSQDKTQNNDVQQQAPGAQQQEAPAPDKTQDGMALIRTYLELHQQHQETDRILKTLASRMTDIEEDIINYLEAQNTERVVMKSLSVSISRDISTSVEPDQDGTMAAFHQDMRNANLGNMIKESIHPQTLRAWIREQRRENKTIPETIARHLIINDTAKLSIKKA